MVGARFETKLYGTLEIIQRVASPKRNLWKVKFLLTGTEVTADIENIKRGLVKDRFYPSVAGKGFLGSSTSTANPSIYARWKRMMLACYDPMHADYRSNQLQKVTVDEEWFNYANYERDILELLKLSSNPTKYRIERIGPTFSKKNMRVKIL